MREKTILLLAGAALPWAAAAQTPEIKTGLWESTVKMQGAGMASMVDTSKMTPEQKARVEAMTQRMGSNGMGGMGERTVQSCVTKEDLERKSGAPLGGDTACEYSYTTRSATKLAGTMECHRNGGTQSGDFSFESHGADAWSGTTHVHMAQGSGRPGMADMTIETSSRWLGGDCKGVKPRQ